MPSRNTPSEQSGAGNNAASGGEASSSDASGGKTANCAEADSAEPENAPRAGAPKRRRTGRSFWLVVLLFAWLFADVLAADANLAFRDAAHFYHPLLQYVRQSWYRGEVPLWNPWENFGEPLAASPTAMVFYPGSVLLLAPIPYDWAYKLFILAHLVLAAWGAACVARRYGRSPAAATLAALAYAGSGHVLFQHCNPIYLVGAAWLPLAWLAIDRLVHARSVRAAASLAVVMAMIVLGGDPHLAYNAGLAALLLVWLKRRSVPQVPDSRCWQFAHHPLCLLAFSALLAVSLSAVQLAPALRLSQRSERGPADVPRNLYELSATALSGTLEHDGPVPWYAVLVGKPAPPEMHLGNLYDFSIGPWRLAELVWPNVGGQAFPQRQRWFDAIPAERRYWTVSLYLGVIPLVLGLLRMRFCRAVPRVRWLSWTFVLATLASLGEYGPGWIAKEMAGLVNPAFLEPGNQEFPAGNACGGLYWLLVVALPGYVGFRYPGKWFTLSALALALLAAGGWDSLRQARFRRRACRWLSIVATVSLVLGLAAIALRGPLLDQFDSARKNILFGPLLPQAAWFDLLMAFVQTAVIVAAAWAVIARGDPAAGTSRGRLAAGLLLVVATVDLAVAHRWLVIGEPAGLWHETPATVQRIREHAQENDWRFYRVWRSRFSLPSQWNDQSSPDRLAQLIRRDRATLYPHLTMPMAVRVVPFSSTFTLWDVQQIIMWMTQAEPGMADSLAAQWFEACGIGFMIAPDDAPPPSPHNWQRLELPEDAFPGIALWARRKTPRRAWLVTQVEAMAPPPSGRPKDLAAATEAVLARLRALGGPERAAVVEAPGSAVQQWLDSWEEKEPMAANAELGGVAETVVIEERAGQVEVAVTSTKSALLVLNELYDAHWKAQLVDEAGRVSSVPIYRTNRLFQGVAVPAGQHRVIFRYRPGPIYIGAALSAAAWIMLMLWQVRTVVAARRQVRQCAMRT